MMGRGARYINFSPAVKPDGQPMSDSELDTEAYQLNRMGDDIAPAGLDLMVHHHGAEMRITLANGAICWHTPSSNWFRSAWMWIGCSARVCTR